VQTRENHSTDWIKIGDEFQKTLKSIRGIARDNGVSDTAVRKEAKRRGWVRPSEGSEGREPQREPECEPSSQTEFAAKAVAGATVQELTTRGRGIILDLMSELEMLNKNAMVISEIVECWFDGEKDGSARNKLLKALDHETRTKSSNYLATALAKLNDAAPGKKEQAAAAAQTAGHGSAWGDDLDVSPATRPN
jgi:hypothetical protein